MTTEGSSLEFYHFWTLFFLFFIRFSRFMIAVVNPGGEFDFSLLLVSLAFNHLFDIGRHLHFFLYRIGIINRANEFFQSNTFLG